MVLFTVFLIGALVCGLVAALIHVSILTNRNNALTTRIDNLNESLLHALDREQALKYQLASKNSIPQIFVR